MKFKVEVELDEMFEGSCNEDGEWIASDPKALEDVVIEKISNQLLKGMDKRVGPKVAEILDSEVRLSVNKILGPMLEGFMDKHIEITNEWGKVTYSGSVREKVTAKFESFLTEKVREDGRDADSYNQGAMTRTEWFVSNVMKEDMSRFTKDTVAAIKDAVKGKLTADLQAAVGTEIVNSIGVKNVLDRLKLTEKT